MIRAGECASPGSCAFFLSIDTPRRIRHPMVQEVVGLGLQGVRSDRHDRVGEFSVLVAIVELAYSHIASRMHLGVVSRPIVNADVLDLHCAEVELSRAPCIFVAAAGPAVIESRNVQAVLALGVDHRCRHARNKVERVVPAGRLHLTIAPYHRFGQPLLLSRTRFGKGFLGHARASDRAKS